MRKHMSYFLACLLCVFSLYGKGLNDYRAEGAVGELKNGYIEAIKPDPSDELKAFIEKVNKLRKQKYQSLAKKNKVSQDSVEAMMGKKLFGKLKSGFYYKTDDAWKKKE